MAAETLNFSVRGNQIINDGVVQRGLGDTVFDNLNLERWLLEKEAYPKTEFMVEAEDVARNFVEQTVGVKAKGDVFWVSQPNMSFGNAVHQKFIDAIKVGVPDEHTELPEAYMQFIATAVLVHEFAHATIRGVDLAVVDDDGIYLYDPPSGLCPVRLRPSAPHIVSSGDFFEEAFAEETAARWREAQGSLVSFQQAVSVELLPVPARYYNYDPSFKYSKAKCSVPAYAAQALSVIGQETGVDMYELMMSIRNTPENVNLKRQFIETIESFTPGLYRMMRDAQYGAEEQRDFSDILTLVNQRVESSS